MEGIRHTLVFELTKLIYQLINLPIESIRLISKPGSLRGTLAIDLDEFLVLDYINEQITCNMKDLVLAFSIPPSTATGIVDRLVWMRYVDRSPSEEDRRAINLKITPEGQRALIEHRPTIIATMAAPLQNLATEELQTLVQLIQKINTEPQ